MTLDKIKTGFKFSSNEIVDNSLNVDFNDVKITNVESLNMKNIIDKCIQTEDFKKLHELFNDLEIANAIRKIYKECGEGGTLSMQSYKPTSSFHLKVIIDLFVNYVSRHIDLNWIDVSNIDDLSNVFYHSKFNGDISKWDVSNVVNMEDMFNNSKFNGDISNWDVSNVTNMESMFEEAKFNGDISKWNVSNVKRFNNMFNGAWFNGNISSWIISEEYQKNAGLSKSGVFYHCHIPNKNKPVFFQEEDDD